MATAKADFYELLGVTRTADDKMLKAAYRKLAMQFHPDRNPGDHTAEIKFKEVSAAYECLKDPQKRAAYDRFGHAAFENGGGGSRRIPRRLRRDHVRHLRQHLRRRDGRRAERGTNASRGGRERGADLRYNMEITLEEAFAGKTAEIEVPTKIVCKTCSGSGSKPGSSPKTCPTCEGHGRVRAAQGFFSIERTCPTCQGRGAGHFRSVRRVPRRRPRDRGAQALGQHSGRHRGRHAHPPCRRRRSRAPRWPAGDLYIFLSIKPHEFFQRDGADIFCRVPVSVTTAALGGEFQVPTIDGGKTRVKVPDGTQTGKQFRLKGKGMPVLRAGRVGDMYIQVVVETPQNLTRRQRELLEEFEQVSSPQNNPESTGFFARVRDFLEGLGG